MDSAHTPVQSLNQQLHGCNTGSKIELLNHLGCELRGRGPSVIVCTVSSQDEAEELEGSFSRLYSDLDKIRKNEDAPISLGLVCFCPKHDKALLDFTRGLPVISPDPILSGPAEFAWNAYLHYRVAWEAGGHIDIADEISSMTAEVAIGDDNALENILNRFANAALARHGLEFTHCVRILERWLRGQESFIPLEDSQLLTWRPQATTRCLVPYIARAILINESNAIAGELRDAIRSATVCQPLTQTPRLFPE